MYVLITKVQNKYEILNMMMVMIYLDLPTIITIITLLTIITFSCIREKSSLVTRSYY